MRHISQLSTAYGKALNKFSESLRTQYADKTRHGGAIRDDFPIDNVEPPKTVNVFIVFGVHYGRETIGQVETPQYLIEAHNALRKAINV
jgi:hypothetical protein